MNDPTIAQLKHNVSHKVHARKASLTEVEQAFLHALLVDESPELCSSSDSDGGDCAAAEQQQKELLECASRRLDDDILFSVPKDLDDVHEKSSEKETKQRLSQPHQDKKDPRIHRLLVGLWQAYEDGFGKKRLTKMEASLSLKSPLKKSPSKRRVSKGSLRKLPSIQSETEKTFDGEVYDGDNDDIDSVRSDEEVRTSDDVSDCSWDEENGGLDHFDAWQVLKDEYAKESGFDYTPDGSEPNFDDTVLEHHTFKILGTSADDISARPHVLSPPCIDSLMNFLPDHLEGQNIWMKFSLLRDGCNLDTFKQYVRAAKDSILAIETTTGEVFGAYTSSAWRTQLSFFGGPPSFTWRMRHNRNLPCYSLIDQAQLESEIDVYFLLDNFSRPQCLRSDMLAVGESEVPFGDDSDEDREDVSQRGLDDDDEETQFGFAIALKDDLLSGTSSPCASYTSPCLIDTSSKTGKPFEVLNMELWTFTPCFSLDSAEKLEMTQFFVSESARNSINSAEASCSSSRTAGHEFSSQDLNQQHFYRRLGHGNDNEELRDSWQYRNMMDGVGSARRGLGASPRFNNASYC